MNHDNELKGGEKWEKSNCPFRAFVISKKVELIAKFDFFSHQCVSSCVCWAMTFDWIFSYKYRNWLEYAMN